MLGPLGQYIATSGDGWDGPGRNGAQINYHLRTPTAKLSPDGQTAELLRAMAEWSRVAKITFVPSSDDSAARTISIGSIVAGSSVDDWIQFLSQPDPWKL